MMPTLSTPCAYFTGYNVWVNIEKRVGSLYDANFVDIGGCARKTYPSTGTSCWITTITGLNGQIVCVIVTIQGQSAAD